MRLKPATLLFCPGHRSDRFDQAYSSGAPGMVLDLEDGVGFKDKGRARLAVFDWLAQRSLSFEENKRNSPPSFIFSVRINELSSDDGLEDLYALKHARALPLDSWLMVPKVQSADELKWLATHLLRKAPTWRICALIESGAGLRNLREIAAVSSVVAVGFGGADLCADLRMHNNFEALQAVRSRFVIDASGHDLHLLDVPHLNWNEDQVLRDMCLRVKVLGFGGKFAIHPKQIKTILQAFAPSPEELQKAQNIVDAFEASGGSATQVDGQMVDQPIYMSALALLATSARGASPC